MMCMKCSAQIGTSNRRDFTSLCRTCYQKQYRELNKQKIVQLNRSWYQANRKKDNKDSVAYQLARLRVDTEYKLLRRLRLRLHQAIKGNFKNGSAVSALGCSIQEFKKYLEERFQPGMTWNNWSKYGWHIDHIKPLASFDLSNPEELKKACHYTNLQPLWAKDNLRKGAKYAT